MRFGVGLCSNFPVFGIARLSFFALILVGGRRARCHLLRYLISVMGSQRFFRVCRGVFWKKKIARGSLRGFSVFGFDGVKFLDCRSTGCILAV